MTDKDWEQYRDLVLREYLIDDFKDFMKTMFFSGKMSEKEYEKEIEFLKNEKENYMTEWKKREDLKKTGMILTLCKDDTGIYHQLMTVIVENNKITFYENASLGTMKRVYPDKIMGAIYLSDLCPDDVVKELCGI